VTENYFRSPADFNAHLLDGMPQAQIKGNSFLDSYYNDDEIPTGSDLDVTAAAADISMQELDTKYQTWLHLRQQLMTELTYEEYLGTFGVKMKPQDELKPELLFSSTDWTYPSNTINSSTGAPVSALSWAPTIRSDKDRFFREPGFIFVVTIARPKVYLSKQTTFASSMLNDCLSWLPAIMKDRVETSMKKFVQDTGPLGVLSNAQNKDYWLDVRDLFTYGDQFVNFALDDANNALVGLPVTDHEYSRYAPDADIDALFVGVTDATRLVRQDGVANIHVLGTQLDHT